MSFKSKMKIRGIPGKVDKHDIVRFEPTSTGPNTAGDFFKFFDGSDVGLTEDGENIDGITFDELGRERMAEQRRPCAHRSEHRTPLPG